MSPKLYHKTLVVKVTQEMWIHITRKTGITQSDYLRNLIKKDMQR